MSRDVFLLPFLIACGPGALSHTSALSFAELHGQITSAATTPDANTRAALVWNRVRDAISSDLGPVAGVGGVFSLAMTAPPPREALSPCGESCMWAVADLGIYEDSNGNRQLDLVANDATNAPDHVLGTLQGVSLAYFNGAPDTTQDLGSPPLGLSWMDRRVNPPSYSSLSTVVDIQLDSSIDQQPLMCREPILLVPMPTGSATTAHAVYPELDKATGLMCADNGQWTASLAYPMQSACMPEGAKLVITSDLVWSPSGASPPPSDWPCLALDWLVGSWVLVSADMAESITDTYSRDGTWISLDQQEQQTFSRSIGRFSLNGTRLTTTQLNMDGTVANEFEGDTVVVGNMLLINVLRPIGGHDGIAGTWAGEMIFGVGQPVTSLAYTFTADGNCTDTITQNGAATTTPCTWKTDPNTGQIIVSEGNPPSDQPMALVGDVLSTSPPFFRQ